MEYTAIIVDEAQDINAKILDYLYDISITNNIKYYLFYDKYQMLYQKKLPKCLDYFDCKLTLNKNCRNSLKILHTLNSIFNTLNSSYSILDSVVLSPSEVGQTYQQGDDTYNRPTQFRRAVGQSTYYTHHNGLLYETDLDRNYVDIEWNESNPPYYDKFWAPSYYEVWNSGNGSATNDNNTDYNNGLFTKESLQQEYNKMMASVEKYKGFYVGRYELGLQETQAVSKNANIIEKVTTAEASNTNTNMWYGLYSKCKEYAPESSNKSVVSSMIWGSQYNAMLNWMAKQGEPVGTIDNNKFNSTGTTGNNSNDVIRNIFDLYGCHREWTLEASANNFRISYGGDFGSSASPSNYTGNSPIDENVNISTRFSLYIK